MKNIFYIAFILITTTVFSQVKIGGAISQTSTADNYPTHTDTTQYGGFRVLADTFARNNLKSSYRKAGMTVYCSSEAKTYQLVGGTSNSNWVIPATGADSSIYSTQQWTKNWVNNKAGYLTTATTIYIDSLGNDVTGLGTLAKPYASIGRACRQLQNNYIVSPSVIITFQFGKGTIAVPDSDWYALKKLNFMSFSAVQIYFRGTYDTINTTTTWTAQASPNNYVYNAGNPVPTWTTDQYKYYFVKQGTLIAPIESNTANTAIISSAPSQVSMTGIYKLRTILQCETNSKLSGLDISKIPIWIYYINLKINSTGNFIIVNPMTLQSCIIENIALNAYITFSAPFGQTNSYYNVFLTNYSTSSSSLGCVQVSGLAYLGFTGCIFANTNASKNGCALAFRQYNPNCIISGSNILNIYKDFQYGITIQTGNITGGSALFKNISQSAFNLDGTSSSARNYWRRLNVNNVYMFNTLYLINSALGAMDFEISNLYGTYTSVFLPTSPSKQFANALYNYNLKIPNTFPEYAQYQTATMANNTTDSIAIGNKTYTRMIDISYTITRGTNYRKGKIQVLNTGTALVFDLGSYIETADLGVTLNGVYFGGTTLNDIKLKWTTTNTGTGATITYDVNRQNY